jgi:hypothetical protein
LTIRCEILATLPQATEISLLCHMEVTNNGKEESKEKSKEETSKEEKSRKEEKEKIA